MFRTGDTAYKQKLTPHTGYNFLYKYVVLPYYLCTATRLLASMSNLRERLAVFGTTIAAVTKQRVALEMPG